MRFSYLLLLGFICTQAYSAPVIQKTDRAELNWTTMKIRFYGEGELSRQAFADIEKGAIQEGLDYIFKQLPEIRKENFKISKLDGDHQQAALELTKRTYPIQTNVTADGVLTVELESSLVTALKPLVEHNQEVEPSSDVGPKHTGIVIKIKGDFNPKPVYKLVDEEGDLLYSHKDVSEAAFEKNLMGRYIKGYSKQEIRSISGREPLEVDASVDGDGNLKVNNAVWDEVLRTDASLVRSAKILLVI